MYIFETVEEQKKIHDLMCVCGHKFYMHAFTMGFNILEGKSVYHPSQCVSCNCKKFRLVKGKDDQGDYTE